MQTDLGTIKGMFQGKYLKFVGEEPIEGKFLGFDTEPDPFAKIPGEMRVVYHLEVDGQDKTLGSKSSRLYQAMKKSGVKVGDFIGIIRHGLAYQTDYEVQILKKAPVA